MSGSSSFYEAVHATGKALNRTVFKPVAAAFNWASGGKALQKKHLERDVDAKVLTLLGGLFLADVGAVAAAIALAPVIGPLSIPFVVAAVAGGTVTPARIHATYVIGKDEHQKKKAAKAAKKQTQAPAAN